jgi:hypothetical protein
VNKDRSMTDKLWILVFLAYLIMMSVFSYIGFRDGDFDYLIAPIDKDLKFCGIKTKDYDNEKFPYLYFPGLGLDPGTDELTRPPIKSYEAYNLE